MKIRRGKSLVPIVSGVVGGALTSLIFVVLVTFLVIIRCRISHLPQEVKPNMDATLSKFNS